MNADNLVMNDTLKRLCVSDERYNYPVYCVIKNTNFWQTKYDQWRPCYSALSDFRCLLLVECDMFTDEPIRTGRLGFDDLLSLKIRKGILGQYKLIMVMNIDGKKKKFIFRMFKKVYNSNFDEQEYNVTQLISELEKLAVATR